MKLFAYIMSFLILAMSCMPCMDASASIDNETKTVVSAASHQSFPKDSDNCSPFCICKCCSGFVVITLSTQISYLKPLLIQKKPLYLSEKISSISLPIWQPPQLG